MRGGFRLLLLAPIEAPSSQATRTKKRSCVCSHPYFRRADEQHIFIETSYRMTKGRYQWFLSLILRRRSANRRSADITLILVGRNGPYPITLTLLINDCMVNTFQVHEHLLFGSNLLILKNEIRNLGSVNECLCTRFFLFLQKILTDIYKDYTSMKCKKRRNGMEPKFTNISHSKKQLRHISNTHKYPLHRCTSDIQFSHFIKRMLAKNQTLDAWASQAL